MLQIIEINPEQWVEHIKTKFKTQTETSNNGWTRIYLLDYQNDILGSIDINDRKTVASLNLKDGTYASLTFDYQLYLNDKADMDSLVKSGIIPA